MATPKRMRAKSIGHYILGKTIGEGTFGKVKLGTHILTGEKVAVKILEKERIVDVADVERIAREIHILKLIRHPHVIQLYEIIETPRQLYLIMEYCSGGELFDHIVASGRVPEREACRFFHQILAGLEQIHAMNVVHRDLKPENLLLDDNRRIKIVDFGLSNTYQDGQLLKTACGSPCYAAPEMIAGKRYVPSMCDVWSCGVILFALICGYLPFEDQNTAALYKKILNAEYQCPRFVSDVARDLLGALLTTAPERRITLPGVRQHAWYRQIPEASVPMQFPSGENHMPEIEEEVLEQLDRFGFPRDYAAKCLQMNKHNHVTTTYYLLSQKRRRLGNQPGGPQFNDAPFVDGMPAPDLELDAETPRTSPTGGQVPKVNGLNLDFTNHQAPEGDRAGGASPANPVLAPPAPLNPVTSGRGNAGWAHPASPRDTSTQPGVGSAAAAGQPVATPRKRSPMQAGFATPRGPVVPTPPPNTGSGSQTARGAMGQQHRDSRSSTPSKPSTLPSSVTPTGGPMSARGNYGARPSSQGTTPTVPAGRASLRGQQAAQRRYGSAGAPDGGSRTSMPNGPLSGRGIGPTNAWTARGEGPGSGRASSASPEAGMNLAVGPEVAPPLSARGAPDASAGEDAMKTCRGAFNVSCTSSKNPRQIMSEIQRALTIQRVAFKQVSAYKTSCQKQAVRFEMEVSHLDHLESIYVVRFRRVAGEAHQYKDLCSKILAEMKV